MEYGTLTNAINQRSNEPSAFGTSWTAGGWVVALEQNISELYHWRDMDKAGERPLLYGWGWLLAVGELFVGCKAAPLSTSLPFTSSRDDTAVVGIGALDPGDGSVF